MRVICHTTCTCNVWYEILNHVRHEQFHVFSLIRADCWELCFTNYAYNPHYIIRIHLILNIPFISYTTHGLVHLIRHTFDTSYIWYVKCLADTLSSFSSRHPFMFDARHILHASRGTHCLLLHITCLLLHITYYIAHQFHIKFTLNIWYIHLGGRRSFVERRLGWSNSEKVSALVYLLGAMSIVLPFQNQGQVDLVCCVAASLASVPPPLLVCVCVCVCMYMRI